MDDVSNNAPRPPCYSLSEESHLQLQGIRDQLFLMSRITFAATLEEEYAPLEIRRSMLAQCFENFGAQIDDVQDAATWSGRKHESFSQRHS